VSLRLRVLPGRLAVCRLPADVPPPDWATAGQLVSVTRTAGELSVVCPEEAVPAGVVHEAGFRALEVAGPLDFALTGIVAALAAPLAQAGVPIFVLSTYDTDYLLVREMSVEQACAALEGAGVSVVSGV